MTEKEEAKFPCLQIYIKNTATPISIAEIGRSEWSLEMHVYDWHVCIFTSKIKVRRLFSVATHGPPWTSNVPHTEDFCKVLMSDVLQRWMALSLGKLHPLFLSASKNYRSLRTYLEQVFYLWTQLFSFGTLRSSLNLHLGLCISLLSTDGFNSLSLPLCRWCQMLPL